MTIFPNRALSASIVMLVGAVLFSAVTIVLQSFIGHTGGSVALGYFTAANVAIQFISMLILFGTPSVLTRNVSMFISVGDIQQARNLLSSTIIFSVFSSLIICVIALILFNEFRSVGVFNDILERSSVFWLVSGGLFLALSKLVMSFYYASFRIVLATLISLIGVVVAAILIVLSVVMDVDIGIVKALALGFGVSVVLGFILLVRNDDLSTQLSWGHLQDLLVFSLPLFGVSVVAFGSTWLDRILVGMMGGLADIGILTSAVIVVRIIRYIPQILTPIYVTTYSRIHANSSELLQYSKAFSVDVFLVSMFCIGSALLIYIWAPIIVPVLWGENFGRLTVIIMRIELIGVIGLAYSVQTPNFLIVMGQPKYNLRLAVAHIALQSILSVILLLFMGIIGVAVATSLTMIIMAGVRHRIIEDQLGVKIHIRPIIKLVTVFGLSVAVYYVMAWSKMLSLLGVALIVSPISIGLLLFVLVSNRSALRFLKIAVNENILG